MLNFLRNLTKSAEAKRQEAISAYLDDALTPAERRPFEQQLARDPRLQAEVEQQRLLLQAMRQLPRRPLPRNFTLDPARYGRPQRQPLLNLYPVLRAATALTAVLFVFAIVLDLLTPAAGVPAFQVASDAAPVAVEVTRVVGEVVVEGEPVEETEIALPEAMAVEEAPAAAVEEEAEEPAAEEPPVEEPLPEAGALTLEADEATDSALERTADATTPVAEEEESLPFRGSPVATSLPDAADTANGAPTSAAAGPVMATATSPAEATRDTDTGAIRVEPLNTLRWLQICFGAALILLLFITYLARRQL